MSIRNETIIVLRKVHALIPNLDSSAFLYRYLNSNIRRLAEDEPGLLRLGSPSEIVDEMVKVSVSPTKISKLSYVEMLGVLALFDYMYDCYHLTASQIQKKASIKEIISLMPVSASLSEIYLIANRLRERFI